MLGLCWAIVCTAGPTIIQRWVSVSCLMGKHITQQTQCCFNACTRLRRRPTMKTKLGQCLVSFGYTLSYTTILGLSGRPQAMIISFNKSSHTNKLV